MQITTNNVEVLVDEDAFFDKYCIISFYKVNSINEDNKCLPYDYLSNIPVLSVVGIRALFDGNGGKKYTKFFVLTKHNDCYQVKHTIECKDENIKATIDNLEDYEDEIRKRIFLSLAINSIGKRKDGKAMYNNAALYVIDDLNFLATPEEGELVCLNIGVNEYLNLTARTNTFSTPVSIDKLKDYVRKGKTVFQLAKSIGEEGWLQALKPVVLNAEDIKGNITLENYYIKRKSDGAIDTRNIVPYWPYPKKEWTHGRLYAMEYVRETVNKAYEGILSFHFVTHNAMYEGCKPKKEVMNFLIEYMSGRKIIFEDGFKTEKSAMFIDYFKKCASKITNDGIVFTNSDADFQKEMTIRLVNKVGKVSKKIKGKVKDVEQIIRQDYYKRDSNNMYPLQHVIIYPKRKTFGLDDIKIRRILIELFIKDINCKGFMPSPYKELMQGWAFYRYIQKDNLIYGGSLETKGNGKMIYNVYGDVFGSSYLGTFAEFCTTKLHFFDYEKIMGAKDYMAMTKNGNTYLIIDTEEIPVLDKEQIEEGYDTIKRNGITENYFKKAANKHLYLGGYIGLHYWQIKGIEGENDGSISYIAGKNSESITSMTHAKMDRMPRARKLFVLSTFSPENVNGDIKEILTMLKVGIGRWNEFMNYPFPFKFLREFMDWQTEHKKGLHWERFRGSLKSRRK